MLRFTDRASAIAICVALSMGIARADPTASDVEKARVMYNEALDLRDASDHKGALQLFLAAFAHVHSPVIGLDLALAHIKLGQLVEALDVVEIIGRIPPAAEETEKSTAARAAASRLAIDLPKRVALIRIATSRPLATGEQVLLDGVAVSSSQLATARRVNPGKHSVVFRLGPEVRREVELEEGEVRDVALPAEAKKPELAAPPVVRDEPRRVSPLTYLGFGVASGAFVVGSITGLTAFSRTSALDHACAPNGDCPPGRDSDIRSAKTMGNISTISFAVAGTGVVVGVLGLLGVGSRAAPPSTQGTITPVVGLGSVGLVGSF